MLKKHLLIGILVLLCIGLISLLISEKKANKRLKANQSELLLQQDIFTSEAEKRADDVKQLELTISELKAGKLNLLQKINEQDVKIKKLERINTTSYNVITEIKTIVKDSIIIRDSIPKVVNKVYWSDGYSTIDGILDNKELIGKITYTDTLVQALYPIYNKFIFRCRLWGVKEFRQKAFFQNPNAKIKYQEVIKIKK